MKSCWHKISRIFSWFNLCRFSWAARSAAPWFGSQSHSTAYPLSQIFLILSPRFQGRRVTGESISITSIFFQLSILIYYSQRGISFILHLVLYQDIVLTLCGRIWCGVGIIAYPHKISAHLHRSYRNWRVLLDSDYGLTSRVRQVCSWLQNMTAVINRCGRKSICRW